MANIESMSRQNICLEDLVLVVLAIYLQLSICQFSAASNNVCSHDQVLPLDASLCNSQSLCNPDISFVLLIEWAPDCQSLYSPNRLFPLLKYWYPVSPPLLSSQSLLPATHFQRARGRCGSMKEVDGFSVGRVID